MSTATSNAPSTPTEQCSKGARAMHATYATDATDVRVQDQGRSSSVPERARGAVDNSIDQAVRTVPVTLPMRVWGRLASRADVLGEQVADVIADAIIAVLEGSRPQPAVEAPKPVPRVIEPASVATVDIDDEDLVAEIVEHHGLNWSAAEIAKKFGYTYDAMRVASRDLGLKNRRAKQVRIDGDRLDELHSEGMSDAQIAEQLGASVEGVRQARVRLGLPAIGRPGRVSGATRGRAA